MSQRTVEYAISDTTSLGHVLIAREHRECTAQSGILYLSMGSNIEKMKRELRETISGKAHTYRFTESLEGSNLPQILKQIVWRYIDPPEESVAEYQKYVDLTDAQFVEDVVGGVDYSHGTSTQKRIWSYLLHDIPRGEVRSYGDIAKRIGLAAGSARSIGQACGRNRIALLVPCHRVRGSKGALTGFRWETWRKQKLLEKEIGMLESISGRPNDASRISCSLSMASMPPRNSKVLKTVS